MNAGVVVIISINIPCAMRFSCAEGLIRLLLQNTCLCGVPVAPRGDWRGFRGPLAGLLLISGVHAPRLVQRHGGLEDGEKTSSKS